MSRAADRTLDAIVTWAAGEPCISRLVLVGSRASATCDDLSDIDVQLYGASTASLLQDDRWLDAIGEVAVQVRDEYVDGSVRVPTRLVILTNGVKVDFAFYPTGPLSAVTAHLPHRILFARDAIAPWPQMQAECDAAERIETEFLRIVEEFWFETYHVAKYLARGNLQLAAERDGAARQWLARLREYYERATVHPPATSPSRQPCSAASAGAVNWAGMAQTIQLFRRLAVETAKLLGTDYPALVDERVTAILSAMAPDAGELAPGADDRW